MRERRERRRREKVVRVNCGERRTGSEAMGEIGCFDSFCESCDECFVEREEEEE